MESRTPGTDVVGELMRAAWRGDEETYGRLFDAWFAALYAEAWRRTRSRARAEALARKLTFAAILDAAERPLRRSLGRVA